MSPKAMSLKGRIKNYAKGNNIAAQVVLQKYMFERLGKDYLCQNIAKNLLLRVGC